LIFIDNPNKVLHVTDCERALIVSIILEDFFFFSFSANFSSKTNLEKIYWTLERATDWTVIRKKGPIFKALELRIK
jgi:hypothetical protein